MDSQMKPKSVTEIMLLPADHFPDIFLDPPHNTIKIPNSWFRGRAMLEMISKRDRAVSEDTVIADLNRLVGQAKGGGAKKALAAMTKPLGGRPPFDDDAALAEVVELRNRDPALSVSKACYIVAGTITDKHDRKSTAARLARHMSRVKKGASKLLK